jgi:GNAT superfamily N-acetyltransferase
MIRPARDDESHILTRISFASKGYWNYPKEYFNTWKNELTISSDYIFKNDVFLFEDDGAVSGYYAIVQLKEDIEASGIRINKGFWLEHMFILPRHIGQGIGTKMFKHLQERCRTRTICDLGILADPNSRGFYEKMGCKYMGEYPSTIKNRTTPLLHLQIQ